MTHAETVRLWNARRGLARAARQLANEFDNVACVESERPTDSTLSIFMWNLSAAIDEVHAAELNIPPD